ncbi:MAG: NF038122 family metalloprotease [Cyanobacteria bacterium J06600_6]
MESGLQFDFSYAAGTSWEQMVAFETAGLMWSDYIADNMTVNIHVEMTSELPENVIGGALPGMVADVNYTDFRNAYHNDITSWRDARDFDSLSLVQEGNGGKGPGGTWEKFEARIDFGSGEYLEDSSELNMTRANAKALGLIAGNDFALDGYIMMSDLSNTSIEWDYSKHWTPKDSLDFLSTAVHEIGHVLGFVSGVDKYEGLKFDQISSLESHFGTFSAFKSYLNSILDFANPLDLFRYSQESLDLNNGRNTIDMSIGTQTYFGPAQLWDAYATGKETSLNGDGFQASHWKYDTDNNFVVGIMDPVMKPGAIRRISDRDLRAMDSIGYNVNSQAEGLLSNNTATYNWQPSTEGGSEIGTLQWRAKDSIAKSLYSDGQASWVDWWIGNDPESASLLSSDKSGEIDRMIEASEVYEGRRSSQSRSSRYSRQEIFFSESYFSELSVPKLDLESAMTNEFLPTLIVEIPQSSSIFADFNTGLSDNYIQSKTTKSQTIDVLDSVAMNLLTITELEAEISTITTRHDLKLPEKSSLDRELAKSDLV